uniref:NADH:ubiquinone reductase (H(+)-translocating) n=1 Tax=Potamotrygonocestus sp. MZUSP 7996 TaxID=2899500 RepID=A0A8K1W6L1_9CEST|nr:NADH dehydrogenase subunit 5 [Potamotrygonocestus sp. MZUSP 7996]
MMINFFLFFISLLTVGFSWLCFTSSVGVSLVDLTINGMYWNIFFNIDYVTIMILLMLIICFGYAYFYTGHYFSNGVDGLELNKLVCLFVGVMATLVCTGDLVSTLILWEYLGVISFFLILFYANYLSLRASVVTLVSSRFGDVCLFLLISINLYCGYNFIALSLILFFIIFTKSAGFPFISWLLEAMRAPTPVSSLVHSSTLVAAGVWFSMRYDIFNFISSPNFYCCLLLLTIFITGVCCFFFMDLKKIVALSTCNNISWCVLYLLLGDVTLSLFQLISHGVSKCLLFMLVGDVMSGSGGSQASNCVYSPRLYGNLGIFGLFSIVLGLSGAPFIGVFFTKHLLISGFNNSVSLVLLTFLSFCVFLSYFYSFRLCSILLNFNTSLSCGVIYSFSSGLMVYFWLFINFALSSYLDELSSVSVNFSVMLLSFQIFSCLTAYYFYSSLLFSSWSSSLFGCDNLVELVFSLFSVLLTSISAFFYRWDNNTLSLFNNHGFSAINIINFNLLNILIVSTLFTFIMCFILC